jgi:hypothetical protein
MMASAGAPLMNLPGGGNYNPNYAQNPASYNSSQQNSFQNEDTTLELKVLSSSMRPDPCREVQGLEKRIFDIFSKLHPKDQAVLTLTESFAFQFRRRALHEPPVMLNAAVYISKLRTANPVFYQRIENIVGFRCSACRHATFSENDYQAGAAQLLITDDLTTSSICASLVGLKTHMLACKCVPDNTKLFLSRKENHTVAFAAFRDFIDAWSAQFYEQSKARGYPKLSVSSVPPNMSYQNPKQQTIVNTNNAQFNNVNTNNAQFNNVNNNNAQLNNINNNNAQFNNVVNNNAQFNQARASLAQMQGIAAQQQIRFQQQQRLQQAAMQQRMAQAATQARQEKEAAQAARNLDKEGELHHELESSVSNAFSSHNYGLAKHIPAVIASDLTRLPLSDCSESPFLELLLQCFCAIQQHYNSQNSDDGDTSRQAAKGKIFLECRFCSKSSTRFCLTAATPESTASYINSSGRQHLLEKCDLVPPSIKRKLSLLKPETDGEKFRKDMIVTEQHAEQWILKFQSAHTLREDGKRRKHRKPFKFYRPLTWSFIHKKGAALISDNTLAYKGSQSVPISSGKKVPDNTNDDDVLLGWDGEHIGNRRFLLLLSELRPSFSDSSVSVRQQNVISFTAVKKVIARGGRFLAVSANNLAAPPTILPAARATSIVFAALKQGSAVLLRPPTDTTRTGRGSRVLESEYAPLVGVFDEGNIEFNRPFKRPRYGDFEEGSLTPS